MTSNNRTDARIKNAVCNTCTLKLVDIAYRRAPWFRILREPLKAGMHFLVHVHHISIEEYLVRTPACYNCIRFYKTALKEKSRVFRWLHRVANPVFDFFLKRAVTKAEFSRAKSYARAASEGHLNQPEVVDWMREMKTGLR
jgi:hypothetical protein